MHQVNILSIGTQQEGEALGTLMTILKGAGMVAALMNPCEQQLMTNENQLKVGDPNNDTGQQMMVAAQACCSCGGGTNDGWQEAHITDALLDIYDHMNGPNWVNPLDSLLWRAEHWDPSVHYCLWEYIRCDHEAHPMSIVFFANELTGTIPPSISNITTLRVFCSVLNKLSGTLPDSMQQMTHLEALAQMGMWDLFGAPSISGTLPSIKDLEIISVIGTRTLLHQTMTHVC